MCDYNCVFSKLTDEISKVYFKARREYLIDPSLSGFYSNLRRIHNNYVFRELPSKKEVGIVIWGEPDDKSHYHSMLLQDAGYLVAGTDLSTEQREFLLLKSGYSVLVTRQTVSSLPPSIPKDKTIYVEDHLVGRHGWQYFDFFQPNADEIFLDGGALDGDTSMQFIQWCNGQFGKIIAFEPNPLQRDVCQKKLENLNNRFISFYDKALWKENAMLRFEAYSDSKWDAHVSANGQYQVAAVSADSILEGEKISFIKLDVEGAELEALKGAERIILRNRPRMAVSIYHHPYDFIQIPIYLLSLVPDYRFAIRHYHSDLIETILYVF